MKTIKSNKLSITSFDFLKEEYFLGEMAAFGENLSQHLADTLDCDFEEVVKALESFGLDSTSKVKKSPARNIPKKKVPTRQNRPTIDDDDESDSDSKSSKSSKASASSSKSKASASAQSDEIHPCERVKRNQKEPCGKNARRCVEEKDGVSRWYCGGEKSGCYPIALKAAAETSLEGVRPAKASTAKASKSKQPTTNAGRKAAADAKSESLLRKVTQTKSVKAVSIKTESHGKLWYDTKTRVLFDHITQEAYGVLDEDNDTILPLDDENIRWIEANGFTARQNEDKTSKTKSSKPKPSKTKVTKKASKTKAPESEEEDSDENEPDDEDSEELVLDSGSEDSDDE